MTPSLKDKIITVCNKKIAQKGTNVGSIVVDYGT